MSLAKTKRPGGDDLLEQPKAKRQRTQEPWILSVLPFKWLSLDAAERPLDARTPTFRPPASVSRSSSFSLASQRGPLQSARKTTIFGSNRQDAKLRMERQRFAGLKRLEQEWAAGQHKSRFPSFEQFKEFRAYEEKVFGLSENRAPALKTKGKPTIHDELRRHRQAEHARRISSIASNSLRAPLPISPSQALKQLNLKEREMDRRVDRKAIPRRNIRTHLTPEQEGYVQRAFNQNGLFSEMTGASVSDKDLVRLQPGQWLNDEVINFYMILINKRSREHQEALKKGTAPKRHPKGAEPLDVFAFTSFFYTKLTAKTGYEGVRRWTKKAGDIFKKDAVLMPINLSNQHWVSACINLRDKRFEYYDSMGTWNKNIINTNGLQRLRQWLCAEYKDKKGGELDLSDWEDYQHPEVPQQNNSHDCGVFASQMMECCSRKGASLDFLQENIPYFRRKMVYEIGKQELMDEEWH